MPALTCYAGAAAIVLFAAATAAAGVCDVMAAPYSARCDNATDDAPAIQRALDNAAQCATVVVPAGRSCVSRSLSVRGMSGRTLLVEGTLVIWRDPATYNAAGGFNEMFITGASGAGAWTGPLVAGFTLAGGGAIVGGGRAWWPKGKSVVRPRTLWLPNCSDVTVANLTIVDSPAWNMGLRGDDILIEGMRVESGMSSCGGYGDAPNTDGVNLGGHRITVRNLVVHNGDDCVPVTTGNDGSTSDVLVENVSCECGTNGGVIYNQGGRVSGVVFRNMTVRNTNQGAGFKLSEPGRDATGGLISNVTFENYEIVTPRYAALYVNVFSEDAQPPCGLPPKPDLKNWLTVQDATFRNVSARVDDAQHAGCFRCTPGTPCGGFVFDGVRVTQRSGAVAPPYTCLNLQRPTSTGGSEPAPC